jgi:hypothetical protein
VDLGERHSPAIRQVGLIGGMIAVYRKHNCGAPRCWRIGKHPTADGLHHLCGRHHLVSSPMSEAIPDQKL